MSLISHWTAQPTLQGVSRKAPINIARLLLPRLPLGLALAPWAVMSATSLPTRRSARSAARRAVAAAGDDGGADLTVAAAGSEALAGSEQPHKRQRKAAAAAAMADAATEAAADEQAAAAASPKRGGKGRRKLAAGGPTREYEEDLWGQGYKLVAGVDEAGRGPLAGEAGQTRRARHPACRVRVRLPCCR